MWQGESSRGCIYAELLGMLPQAGKSYLDRGPLFPGTCWAWKRLCFRCLHDLLLPLLLAEVLLSAVAGSQTQISIPTALWFAKAENAFMYVPPSEQKHQQWQLHQQQRHRRVLTGCQSRTCSWLSCGRRISPRGLQILHEWQARHAKENLRLAGDSRAEGHRAPSCSSGVQGLERGVTHERGQGWLHA